MTPATTPLEPQTLADLLERLGDVSPRRILLSPPPGTATEEDVLAMQKRTERICELVDGTLVEKTEGYAESSLASWIIHLLHAFLVEHDLGNVAGEQGTVRLMPRLVRVPDVSFVRWDRLPNRQLPRESIPDLVPDLAVEVLSQGNTPGEMQRKLKDYFLAGVSLVWLVDPATRTIRVHTAPDVVTVLGESDTLTGGAVLPGFATAVRRVFERMPPPAPVRRRKKKDER